ncbi:hypothetical protein CLV31_109147 [Algoriphagus aquaeductus]|uniref:Uncharacterized protein n=1 Tax=Algoriphagus aquaeductus TaxID=475299 RepID=A0A326RQH1_9BACT|nr:hypothetical protein CLV31_109147 [Algoriphagus aquaeductus]
MNSDINNKIDDALLTFYKEADRLVIDELLSERVSDNLEYEKRKRQIVFKINALAQKERNNRLLEVVDKFKAALDKGIEKPVAMLNQLMQGNPTPALYRNLKRLSKEDLIEIIKDKNLIKILEELEENEKPQ